MVSSATSRWPLPNSSAARATKWFTAGNRRGVRAAGGSSADDVQAVEVFAEPAGAHRVFEGGVGGGDDADVDGEGAGLAERRDLAGFEEAREFGLEVEPELADFVEEEGAFRAVRMRPS